MVVTDLAGSCLSSPRLANHFSKHSACTGALQSQGYPSVADGCASLQYRQTGMLSLYGRKEVRSSIRLAVRVC